MSIRIEQLSFSYDNRPFLDKISFCLEDDITFLCGPSGSGKTTLLKLLGGLLLADEGKIVFDEKEMQTISARQRNVAYLWQENVFYPHLTIYENLLIGSDKKIPLEERHQKILSYLKKLHLARYCNFLPKVLSEGQKRKVLLIKMLLKNAPLYLFDEPFYGLDEGSKKGWMEEIKEMQKEVQRPFLIVSHQIEDVTFFQAKVLFLHQGKIKEVPSLSHVYEKPQPLFLLDFAEISYLKVEGKVENHTFFANDFIVPIDSRIEEKDIAFYVIRGEDLVLKKEETSNAQIQKIDLSASGKQILRLSYLGQRVEIESKENWTVGERVFLSFHLEKGYFVDMEGNPLLKNEKDE